MVHFPFRLFNEIIFCQHSEENSFLSSFGRHELTNWKYLFVCRCYAFDLTSEWNWHTQISVLHRKKPTVDCIIRGNVHVRCFFPRAILQEQSSVTFFVVHCKYSGDFILLCCLSLQITCCSPFFWMVSLIVGILKFQPIEILVLTVVSTVISSFHVLCSDTKLHDIIFKRRAVFQRKRGFDT